MWLRPTQSAISSYPSVFAFKLGASRSRQFLSVLDADVRFSSGESVRTPLPGAANRNEKRRIRMYKKIIYIFLVPTLGLSLDEETATATATIPPILGPGLGIENMCLRFLGLGQFLILSPRRGFVGKSDRQIATGKHIPWNSRNPVATAVKEGVSSCSCSFALNSSRAHQSE